uniref:NopRA1 domain-containing protein n=1 Tax=Heterorhabditis bacteriophora TaxID=37862 RepID=A0A1I7WZF5_HETBA
MENFSRWPFVVKSFWMTYTTKPHEFLTCLRMLVVSHIHLNLELRLLSLIKELLLTAPPQLSERMRCPFMTTCRTIFVAITAQVIKRRPVSLHSLLACFPPILHMLGPSMGDTIFALTDVIGSVSSFNWVEKGRKSLEKFVNKEVESLLTEGNVKVLFTLLYETFWKKLYEAIKKNPAVIQCARDKGLILILFLLYFMYKIFHLLQAFTYSTVFFSSGMLFHICVLIWLPFFLFLRRLTLVILIKKVDTELNGSLSLSSAHCHLCIQLISQADNGLRQIEPLHILRYFAFRSSSLCYLVAPYICALDGISESAATILLKFSSKIGQLDLGCASGLRLIRCLAECVDGVGLDYLSCLYDYSSSFFILSRLFLDAKLTQHAFVIANLLFDNLVSDSRYLSAFLQIRPENPEFLLLLRDIYLVTQNAASLTTLPNSYQVNFYLYYLGITVMPPTKETEYLNAIRSGTWDQISYPKKFKSHYERLFCVLYLEGQSESAARNILQFIMYDPYYKNDLYKDLSHENVISVELCKQLSEFTFLSVEPFSIENMVGSIQAYFIHILLYFNFSLFQKRLELLIIFVSRGFRIADRLSSGNRNILSLFIRNQSPVVLQLTEQLIKIKAYSPSLFLLTSWSKICSPVCPDFVHSIELEMCRAWIAKGDLNIAELHLIQMRERSNLNPSVLVDVTILLAELIADYKYSLDTAISIIREMNNSLPCSVSPHIRGKIYLALHRLAVRQLAELELHIDSRGYRMKKEAIHLWSQQLKSTSQRFISIVNNLVCLLYKFNQFSERQTSQVVRRIAKELQCERDAVRRVDEKLLRTASETVDFGLTALGSFSRFNETSVLIIYSDLL